jgi:uncharacterized membrane protein
MPACSRPAGITSGSRDVEEREPLMQGAVFWPYFAGAAITLAGVWALRGEVSSARGPDRIAFLGPLLFAMPMAVFGAEHFASAKTIMHLVPSWMPGPLFWTYFVGLALIAGALSISMKRKAGWSAPLVALMLFLFVVLLHLPNVVSNPEDRIAWAVLFRDLSFSGGALALAGTAAHGWPTATKKIATRAGQIFIAVTTIVFGVEQLLHPDFVPGVPLAKITPAWIPGRILWSYLAGVIFIAAGACLLVNRKTRLAATSLGAVVMLLVLFVYLPLWGANLFDIENGFNYFADTLMFSGAALLLAQAMPKETPSHV